MKRRRGYSLLELTVGVAVFLALFGLAWTGFDTFLRRGAQGAVDADLAHQSALAIEHLRRILKGAVSLRALDQGFEVRTQAGSPDDPALEIWQVRFHEGSLIFVEVRSQKKMSFRVQEDFSSEARFSVQALPGGWISVDLETSEGLIPRPFRIFRGAELRAPEGADSSLPEEVPFGEKTVLVVQRDDAGIATWIVPREVSGEIPSARRTPGDASTREVELGSSTQGIEVEARESLRPVPGEGAVSLSQAWSTFDGEENPLAVLPSRIRVLGKTLLESFEDPARRIQAEAVLRDWAGDLAQRIAGRSDPARLQAGVEALVRAARADDLRAAGEAVAEIEQSLDLDPSERRVEAEALREELGLPGMDREPEALPVREAPRYPGQNPAGADPSASVAGPLGSSEELLAKVLDPATSSQDSLVAYREASRDFLQKLLSVTELSARINAIAYRQSLTKLALRRLASFEGRLQTRAGADRALGDLEAQIAELRAEATGNATSASFRRQAKLAQEGRLVELDQLVQEREQRPAQPNDRIWDEIKILERLRGAIARMNFSDPGGTESPRDYLEGRQAEEEALFAEVEVQEQAELQEVQAEMPAYLEAAQAWEKKPSSDPQARRVARLVVEKLETMQARFPSWTPGRKVRVQSRNTRDYAIAISEALGQSTK